MRSLKQAGVNFADIYKNFQIFLCSIFSVILGKVEMFLDFTFKRMPKVSKFVSFRLPGN